MFLTAVLSGFALSLAAPWLYRMSRGATGWVLALLPVGLTLFFASFIAPIADGQVLAVSYAWVPSLGLNLSFYLDGLSLLFALLISAIGALVLIYSGGYMAGHQQIGRFYAFILAFMASMLGLVLAANALALFVFWELTTITSYLLIGFEHKREEAREGAQQALLVTGAGGLVLLAGLLLLGQAGGSLELPALVEQGEAVRAHEHYLPILALLLIGAFSKSAQVPFHFWLPNAMEAPTPVSAYLHSATMVKAGIYLLARLRPVLGDTAAWWYSLTIVGAVTMLVGAYLALRQTDIKRLLAYTTVSALGMLTLLLGLGTELAAEAAIVFLLAHALYKGALFLVAGNIDHEAGTRDVTKLRGLRSAMPVTAAAAALAALSMAGLPPTLGLIGKELLYDAGVEAHQVPALLAGTMVAANILYVAAAGIAGLLPFTGPQSEAAHHAHKAPPGMWLGPALLAGLGIIGGLLPSSVEPLVAPAIAATHGEPVDIRLALWHGLNLTVVLSALTVLAAAGAYAAWSTLRRMMASLDTLTSWGPERWYRLALSAVNQLARLQTRLLLSGYLRTYVLIIIITAVVLVGYPLLQQVGLGWPARWRELHLYEAGVAGMILIATLLTVSTSSNVGAIAALGVAGYGVALIYVLFSAPDLAITQVMVDTLTVILFVLVFYRIPNFSKLTNEPTRIRDAMIALAAGGLVTLLVLAADRAQFAPPISGFFVETSLPEAHGRNIVNTILVDFRALDTLGEITVLTLAGIGVYALLKLRLERTEEQ